MQKLHFADITVFSNTYPQTNVLGSFIMLYKQHDDVLWVFGKNVQGLEPEMSQMLGYMLYMVYSNW